MSKTDQLPGTHLAPDPADLARLVTGAHHNPHGILGAHPSGGSTVVRAMRKGAKEVALVHEGEKVPMVKVHPDGIFAAEVPGTRSRYFVSAIDARGYAPGRWARPGAPVRLTTCTDCVIPL